MNEALIKNKNNLSIWMALIAALCAALLIIAAGKYSVPIFILGLIVILIVVKPYWGLFFLTAFIPFEGLLAFGPVMSVMKGYGVFVTVASLPVILLYRIKYVSVGRLPLIYLLFVLWSFSSMIWATDVSLCLTKNITHLSLFILYLLFVFLPEDNHDALHLKGFVCGALFSALTLPLLARNMATSSDRIAAGGLNANDYAATIAIAMPLALMWFRSEKNTWMKTIPILFIPTGLLAIAFTKSRGGTIALLPFVIYALTFIKQKGLAKKILPIVFFIVSLFTLIYFAPSGYFERIREVDINSSNRFTHRLDVWIAGKNMFFDNVITGVGTGNFSLFSNKYAESSLPASGLVAHNAFISVAGELGIIGIVLFIVLIFGHFRKLWLLSQKTDDQELKILAEGLAYAFMAYLIASMSLTWEYRKVFPFILGSIMLLSRQKKHAINT